MTKPDPAFVEQAARELAGRYAPMGWLESVRWEASPNVKLTLVVNDIAQVPNANAMPPYKGIHVAVESNQLGGQRIC